MLIIQGEWFDVYIWNESELITKKIGKNFSKMKIETDLKIIIVMFSRLFFAYKRYQQA